MEVKSKRKPQQPAQVIDEKKSTAQQQPASEFSAEEPEQSLVELLQTLRDIHEGACVVTLLITDSTISIQSSQKVIVGEQK